MIFLNYFSPWTKRTRPGDKTFLVNRTWCSCVGSSCRCKKICVARLVLRFQNSSTSGLKDFYCFLKLHRSFSIWPSQFIPVVIIVVSVLDPVTKIRFLKHFVFWFKTRKRFFLYKLWRILNFWIPQVRNRKHVRTFSQNVFVHFLRLQTWCFLSSIVV